MTVQDLIDQLMSVEDKSMKVVIGIESGRGCYSTSDDVDCGEDDFEDDEGNESEVFVISGEETSFDG